MKTQLSCLILFMLVLLACSDSEEKIEFETQETSFQFEKEGGTKTLTILPNAEVSVQSSETWCKVAGYTPTSTSRQYKLTVEANPLQEIRTAMLIITANGFEKQIPVEQAASPEGEAEPYTDKYAVREKLTTNQLVKEMGLGINLGNTLDATATWITSGNILDYEQAWGSPVITKEIIEGYAKAGYSSLRIPVSWGNLLSSDYKIHPDLMNRVESILNWTLDCGMVAVINIHHENEWIKKVPTDSEAKKKYTSIWQQICQRLEKYGDHLMFEPMNEIGYDEIWTSWSGGQAEKAKALGYVNQINQLFVDIVRASGGNNAKRHLLVEIYNTAFEYAYDPLFKMPTDPANRLAITVHYYAPALFAIQDAGVDSGWGVGRATWGTAEDLKELKDNMDLMKKNCVDKGIPVIVGEYAACGTGKSQEMRRLYDVAVTEAIYSRGMCPMLWDAPGDQYNRETYQFRDPEFLKQMMAIPAKYPRN